MKESRNRIRSMSKQRTKASPVRSRRQSALRFRLIAVIGATCLCGWLMQSALGDTLQLRDGTALQGGFVSFDGQTIMFATDQGVQSIPRAQALVLTFAASACRSGAGEPGSQSRRCARCCPAEAGRPGDHTGRHGARGDDDQPGQLTDPAGPALRR